MRAEPDVGHQRGKNAEKRGLPAPVWPQQAVELTRGNFERNAGQRNPVPVTMTDIFYLNHHRAGLSSIIKPYKIGRYITEASSTPRARTRVRSRATRIPV